MANFLGGSAPAMARQVCEGLTRLSPPILKRLNLDQMKALEFEIDKKLRETRGEAVDLDDQVSLTKRGRRITRIEGALRMLRQMISQKKRGRI